MSRNQLVRITRKGSENNHLAHTESVPESEVSKKEGHEKQDLQFEMLSVVAEVIIPHESALG